MSNESVQHAPLPVARRLGRGRKRAKRRSFLPAHGRILSVAQMREQLAAWRASADDGRAQFVLLASGKVRRASGATVARLIENVAAELLAGADAFGWLADGRLGALVGSKPASQQRGARSEERDQPTRSSLLAPRSSQLAPFPVDRIAAFERLLASAISGPVAQYEYPPQPAQHALVAGRSQPQVREGGIEHYFARPTPWWKRILDVSVAAAMLLALSPLLAIVALAIKITSRGPVVYRQLRTGRGGKSFWMYKFRSMVEDADVQQASLQHLNVQDGPAFKIPCDPRVTPLGWWLRESCLDELPQLWNVLRGDMSLVGPRPLPCRESAACLGWRRRRLDVTPGITCLWQAQGRSTTSFDDWMRLDVSYAQQRSLRLDLSILLGTLPLMVPRARRAAKKQTSSQHASTADSRQPKLESPNGSPCERGRSVR